MALVSLVTVIKEGTWEGGKSIIPVSPFLNQDSPSSSAQLCWDVQVDAPQFPFLSHSESPPAPAALAGLWGWL